MTSVSITSTESGVDAAFCLAMSRAGFEGCIRTGDRVLVKPNWNACGIPGSTSMAVVQAACRWAYAQGAREVIVGEGPVPVGPERVREFVAALRVHECLAEVGARFVNFDDGEHVLIHGETDLPAEIGIARLALESDVLINVPLLKVHGCCMTTLCIKNLKGCLRPQDKMAFHRIGLIPAIVALNRLLTPAVNVVDAIDAMAGDHNRGDLVHLGVLIASEDRVAADAVACAQIGLEPQDVPLVRSAARAGLGTHRLEEIALVGEPLRPRKLELSQDRLLRLYPDLDIRDDGACSACAAALMDGLYVAGAQRVVSSIALGAKAKPGPDTLVLGKCLRDYWPTHAHVTGCPPSGHAVAAALTANPRRR